MKDPLAERIKLGDKRAFELFFRMLNVRLCVFANRYLNDPEMAQDIVQDAFIHLWESRDDINPEENLKSYLFKIVQNQAINKLKRRKTESKYIEILKLVYIENNVPSTHELYISGELEDHLAESINQLPAGCREIFRMSRHDGLKYREIADILHISSKTVEAQMSKALKLLRLKLSNFLTIPLIILLTIL
jgi:RNA polymerase sigma-70 factor, ECF subfamily